MGNTANPIYNGAVFADEEDVVYVSVNYRLSIFGFSGAPNITQNVALTDQRLGLEWARDNVAQFGGDPKRITVVGQSAGAISSDLIPFAYPDDPIANAIIAQSGSATGLLGQLLGSTPTQTNWARASEALGCGGEDSGEAGLACMRSKGWEEITNAILPFQTSALFANFGPVPDDVYADYSVQAEAGQFARLPTLAGSTSDEAAFFLAVIIAYTPINKWELDLLPAWVIQPLLDIITQAIFTCPASSAAEYRHRFDIPSWRYRYYGGK